MFDNVVGVILTGGKSSRFNYKDKHSLFYKEKTFLEHSINSFDNLSTYLSINKNSNIDSRLPTFVDAHGQIGPLGAILTSFEQSDTEYIFVKSVDTPLVTNELVRYVLTFLKPNKNLIVKDKKLNPCFGIYHRSVVQVLKDMVKNKDFKMMNLLNAIDYNEIDITNTIFKGNLKNINTQLQYNELIKKNIFCISGYKNSGKTTLIAKLIKHLKEDNISFWVIKHDGHSFKIDNNNTDTSKYRNKGATKITIYDNEKIVTMKYENLNIEEYISTIDSNFIIIEGMKKSRYPKLVISNNVNDDLSQFKNVKFVVSDIDGEYKRDEIKKVYLRILKEFNVR